MLQQRELKKNPNQPKVYFFNTFFYVKLYAHTGKYDFESVRRWFNKLNFSILDCETLVVPIHKKGLHVDHWVSVVINMKGVFLEFLDSGGGDDDDKALENLKRFIVDLHEAEKRLIRPRWTDAGGCLMECRWDIPLQDNKDDCGFFMLTFADFEGLGREFDFNQTHMTFIRRRVIAQILRGKAD
mmetsp:Transcript_39125/g.65734  ORF Transcript_39125/g.65734 Transcript_39125/m.65734 type:complete len:184 (+) Transcript_39125:406-957(+)